MKVGLVREVPQKKGVAKLEALGKAQSTANKSWRRREGSCVNAGKMYSVRASRGLLDLGAWRSGRPWKRTALVEWGQRAETSLDLEGIAERASLYLPIKDILILSVVGGNWVELEDWVSESASAAGMPYGPDILAGCVLVHLTPRCGHAFIGSGYCLKSSLRLVFPSFVMSGVFLSPRGFILERS